MSAILDRIAFAAALLEARRRTEELARIEGAWPVIEDIEAQLARIAQATARGRTPDDHDQRQVRLGPLAIEHRERLPHHRQLMELDYAFRRHDALLPPTASRRHGILRVLYGRDAFRHHVLAPGERVVVGRGERAEMRLRDQGLGARHLELWWDGLVGHLRDLEGAGLSFEGKSRLRAELRHGDVVDAGGVTFRFFVEDHSALADDCPPAPERVLDELEPIHRQGRLYAVLDAARDRMIVDLLNESIDRHRSLYEGDRGRALDDVAPYMVKLDPRSALLERLLRAGWGGSWGLYLDSDAAFERMRRALRRLLMAEVAGRRDRVLFRFYDPRVFRRLLPLATVRQESQIFAAADRIGFEGEDGELWWEQPLAEEASP